MRVRRLLAGLLVTAAPLTAVVATDAAPANAATCQTAEQYVINGLNLVDHTSSGGYLTAYTASQQYFCGVFDSGAWHQWQKKGTSSCYVYSGPRGGGGEVILQGCVQGRASQEFGWNGANIYNAYTSSGENFSGPCIGDTVSGAIFGPITCHPTNSGFIWDFV